MRNTKATGRSTPMASYTKYGPAHHAGLFTHTPSPPLPGRARQVSDCVSSVKQAGAPLLSARHTLQNGVATDSYVHKPCHEYASFKICEFFQPSRGPPRAPAHYTLYPTSTHQSPDGWIWHIFFRVGKRARWCIQIGYSGKG